MTAVSRKDKANASYKADEKKSSITLSEYIFDLRWASHFPLSFAGNETVELVDFLTAQNFILQHSEEVFEVERWGHRFFVENNTPSKVRYYEKIADHFLFKINGQAIGLVVGTLIDGHSYYLRYGMILKSFQNSGRIQKFVAHIMTILKRHGLHRLETDISPSNLINIHVFNKLEFNISGLGLSERWGSLVHFTKILNEDAENIFLEQFCTGPRPQKALRPLGSGSKNKKQGGLP